MSHNVIQVITTLVTHVPIAREGRRAAYPRRAVREAPKSAKLVIHGSYQTPCQANQLVPVVFESFSNGLFPARYYDSLSRLHLPQRRSNASLFAARLTLGLPRSSMQTYSYGQCTTSTCSMTPWRVIQSAVTGSNHYG